FASRRRGGGPSAICGRRSATATTRGDSSAKCSRTTNSSLARAEESRAEAAQSILATSSPGSYGRVVATSDPSPRRALRIPPNASPGTRRRGTSGKTGPGTPRLAGVDRGRLGLEVEVGARPRGEREGLGANLLRRRVPAPLARLGEE